ncbi:disulfide bond formation protein DsbA [Variovorax sp. WS11]|uniref:2-hydroxychromene-2-carboxylate isomerase n=1 Tax=Variovorax sp. WS11 TaxID=1105204 RepID=UPI000D0E2F4D|nr:2-hydroxychromene-2-carboxylate isomerase [Variovorax sp. WS11]NDZ15431.1 2-hydroxychromene-2-carboxylate isomerase [Variovorax sp. WS11]PSL84787.1 disulfide bond formation protein DsbA [Variovorax sp. WS11]
MTVSVQFLFDFGSPNAYMCHRVIPAIEARTGVAFEHVPVLLGGIFKLSGNRSPAEAFAGIPNKRAYDQLEIKRFVAKHQLDRYRHNPFWPVNTLQIMRGAVAAQKQGCFERYVEAVYVAMWEEGRNMEDPEVIVQTLNEAGLDGQRLYAGTQDPEVKSLLLANTQAAFERGAFGSPTFFVGGEIFFGKDRLREVEEEIVRQGAAA